MPDNETTYTVNGEPVPVAKTKTEDESALRAQDGEQAATLPPRAVPAEGITEAEIAEFDRKARETFDRELATQYQEVRPGSKEAEIAIRDAIRQR